MIEMGTRLARYAARTVIWEDGFEQRLQTFIAGNPGQRLGGLDVMKQSVGADAGAWTVREVGDGNLNLVFIVEGDAGSVIVKQALPYVRLVGDSWPLPLKRAFFEYHALIRQEARDPGSVPKVLHSMKARR
jgi:5-methylthioribose kinase